jgi:putative hydrolase of the HAD superfamily
LLRILLGKFDWLDEFDVKIWSCEKGCAKPDEIIYRDCLQQLACAPERSLFFDDRPLNVEAARRVGDRRTPVRIGRAGTVPRGTRSCNR